ncbi:thiosulfate oxidation carrier complex protein SoxZ [Betaproteobacteria bacterium GR16-43]|nr:thiosulfate oxidation carrier complex protein SoxZ [Betaproteobacteria bacterium GR16-43]
MANDIKAKVRLPASIRKGDVVEVKTLVEHPMESGQRKDGAGSPIPRRILHSLRVTFGGREVFAARFEPAIASNPYLAFFVRIEQDGTLEFTWKDDDGSEFRFSQAVALG